MHCRAMGLVLAVMGVAAGAGPAMAASSIHQENSGLTRIQYYGAPNDRRYNGYPNQRGAYPGAGAYGDPRGAYGAPYGPGYRGRWMPGQVIPGQYLNQVVPDWEERGLQRPPGGHQWFRIGQQFVLVRTGDQMISRTVNFD